MANHVGSALTGLGSIGGIIPLQQAQNYMQQQMNAQLAQNYYGLAQTANAATSVTLTNAVPHYTIQQRTPPEAEPRQSDALAWLDRRVNEMRVKL